jgi:hypothetical protein
MSDTEVYLTKADALRELLEKFQQNNTIEDFSREKNSVDSMIRLVKQDIQLLERKAGCQEWGV